MLHKMPHPMYTAHAQDYDKAIASNVFNAMLERPSMLTMLPELQGKSVLDLGCGPGFYTEHFLNSGATVTALDISSEMIAIMNQKFGDRITAYVSDAGQGLEQEQENTFDLIVCPLMIHYIEDLSVLFNDVARVLKPEGIFFFSTHHPLVDFTPSESSNYFQCEHVTETWDTTGYPVEVQFYRRSLTELFGFHSKSWSVCFLINRGTTCRRNENRRP